MNILQNFVILSLPFVIVYANFLPEDSLTDDAEQLSREKRDSFFERIFKTFFKMSPAHPPTAPTTYDSDGDDEGGDIGDSISFDIIEPDVPTVISPRESFPSLQEHLPMSTPVLRHSSQVITATPTISLLQTLNISLFTIYRTSSISEAHILPTSALFSKSSQPSTPVLQRTPIRTSIAISVFPRAELHTSLPHATKSMQVGSITINPTLSSSLYSRRTPVAEMEQPIVQLIIPQLPDERGYAENLGFSAAKVPTNDGEPEVKNVRFLYSNLFIPVMSGLFGALCITIIIMVVHCTKRRKLRKLRYYGGKPESALYGLDHMGLLSDMSSDEE